MAKIGVILSGCGVKDGSEIHEATLTLAAIDRLGHDYLCMAPHKSQAAVINHFAGKTSEGEVRNIVFESARIARGQIRDLATVAASEIDAVVLPGGFGAVANLCDYAVKGADCEIDPQVERFLKEVYSQRKPIGAMCIAPVVVARAFRDAENISLKLTVGTDEQTAAAIRAMGHRHENRDVDELCVDLENRVVTTACYMSATRISEVEIATTKLIAEVVALL